MSEGAEQPTSLAAQPEAVRSTVSAPAELGIKAGLGQPEQKAAPALLSEAITVLTHGWKAYSQEQINKGRWTAEQVAQPERKLLPEMNSKEIRQGVREGVITDPSSVDVMLQKDLDETHDFWEGWYAAHAAERDDGRSLARSEIAAKEAEIQPLLQHPTRQAEYLADQARAALMNEDEIHEVITIKNRSEAANLFEMAARLARLAAERAVKPQEEAEQEETAAKADAVRAELTTLAKTDHAKAA